MEERERARFARDLHDGLCQTLTGIRLGLEMHARNEGQPSSTPSRLPAFKEIVERLDTAIAEARNLAHALAPAPLKPGDGEFCRILHELASHTSLYLGMKCTVACAGAPHFANAVTLHLYRIAQEAIGNAHRHGKATRIMLGLRRQRDKHWRLSISDNGGGIKDQAAKTDGLGLRSMTYRASVIGGALTVGSGKAGKARSGTLVCCIFA